MNILAIDSSATVASCALVMDEKVIGEVYLDSGLVHSTTLAPLVKSLLDIVRFSVKNIDVFAVSNGPGSFTGVRIGVALVKGMAYPIEKKVIGVSTLHALAYNVIDQQNTIVCSCMDARRNQFYAAFFSVNDCKICRLTDDLAISAEDIFKKVEKYNLHVKDIILVGDGANLLFDFLKNMNEVFKKNLSIRIISSSYRYQTAKNVAFAAKEIISSGEETVSANDLKVEYLRPSQAERERTQRLKQENCN